MKTAPKHHIKAWRLYRRLSLRRLADRLPCDANGNPMASHTRLQRVETGLVSYDEPLLHALAYALNCSISDLLGVDPTKDGEVIDLLRLMDDAKRKQAVDYLKFLTKAG